MLTFIIFIAVVYVAVSLHLRIKRQEFYNRIDLIYTQIELTLIKNGIQVTPNLQLFLATRKAFFVNREVIDFEFLVKNFRKIPNKELEKVSRLLEHVKSKLPKDTNALTDDFDKAVQRMIFYNSISTTFLVFVLVEILPSALRLLFQAGFGKIRSRFVQLTENESEIAAKSFGLA